MVGSQVDELHLAETEHYTQYQDKQYILITLMNK